MQEFEIELEIGDVIQIGDEVFTVIDIDNDEVCLRIEPVEDFSALPACVPPGK